MTRMSVRIGALALMVVGLSGCVSESTNGNTTTFSYELWLPLCAIVGGIVATPIGWILRQSIPKLGWALLIIGPLSAILFGPTLLLERSTLDDKSFSVRSGIWGMTAVHSVNFGELNQVRMIVEQSTGRRGRKQTNFFLLCEKKNGTTSKISVNNNVTEKAAVAFLQRVTQLQIPVIDQTNM